MSIDAVSGATNPLTGRPYDTVMPQEQSFTPLPSVNNLGHATRGNYPSFVGGANRLVSAIQAADASAGK